MMKAGRVRRVIIAIILIAVAAVVTVSFLGKKGKESELVFDYYLVKTDAMEERISGTGMFVPRKSATVLAKVSGAIKTLRVEEGDRVRSGAVLLEIDAEDYEQSLESREIALESSRRSARQNLLSLRATYQTASLSYDQARRNYENNKALFEADGISEEVLKQSQDAFLNGELNLKSARERLNLTLGLPLTAEPVMDDGDDERIISDFPEIIQAELAVDTARKTLGYCTVHAPIDGTVTQVLLDEGRIAGPNTPLIVIEALDDMIAEIQIDEVDIGKIQKNYSAEVTSDSLLGKTLRGTVESISPVIQRIGNSRMTEVKVSISPEGNRLKSGASCTVRIAAQAKEAALVIPLTAYTAADEVIFVYVLKQKAIDTGTQTSAGVEVPALYVLEKREIEIGIITVNQAEVVSGLTDGEMLAIGNQSLFREGLEGRLGEQK